MILPTGQRLIVSRSSGNAINIWTNDRTLGMDLEQARLLCLAIQAILNGHDEARTPDTVDVPRVAPPVEHTKLAPKRDFIPTLKDLEL